MKNIYASLTHEAKLEVLEKALDYVGVMIRDRTDGDNYLNIYETLEKEVQDLKAADDTKARILKRLKSRPMQLAA
ncbi:hypothetical protein [Leisingera caerulea]|uniref:hypothetical protein n=1 Tax=Leisingera caerulea TaxID=506591 RepID=UPI0021A6C00B|nr:hypothetical protein [Leisingera caerulea]UWQ83088.1 hypothetical protein K3726_15680 [Leisingera caerulea]